MSSALPAVPEARPRYTLTEAGAAALRLAEALEALAAAEAERDRHLAQRLRERGWSATRFGSAWQVYPGGRRVVPGAVPLEDAVAALVLPLREADTLEAALAGAYRELEQAGLLTMAQRL